MIFWKAMKPGKKATSYPQMFHAHPTGARSFSSSPASIVWASVAVAIWNLLVSSSIAVDLKSRNSIRVCPSSAIIENLLVFQRCSPDEFHEITSCGITRETLLCSKGKYIAVHSASAGKSRRGGESSADCVRTAITNETDCSVECVVSEANELCLGKRRCQIAANDMLFSKPCYVSSGPLPEHGFLWLLYTCVSKNVTKGFHQKTSGPPPDELRCSETPVPTTPTTPAELRLQEPSSTRKYHGSGTRGPFATRVSAKEMQVNNGGGGGGGGGNQEEASSTTNFGDVASRPDAKVYVESAFTRSSADQSTTTQSQKNPDKRNGNSLAFLDSMSEMIWILNYVSDNSEKCILYFLVCIFLGIILVLVVLILHSVNRKRKSERYQFPAVGVRLTDSSNSLKWRMADSESSVDDVDDVRGTPTVGPHAGHGRQWGPHHQHHHGRPIRAWSPPTTTGTPEQTSTVNQTQLGSKPNGVMMYGPRVDERGPRGSEEAEEIIPLHVARTQSLTRGQQPNEPQFYFPEPKSLTMQPHSRRNVEI